MATKQVLDGLASDLPPNLLNDLRTYLEVPPGSSAPSTRDLTKRMAIVLNEKLDIPYLDEQQEQVVLEQVVTVILQVLTTTTTASTKNKLTLDASIDASRNLLSSPANRKAFVEQLNQDVDLPFLDESNEQVLLSAAVDASAQILETMLPPAVLTSLRGRDNNNDPDEGLAATKEHLVERVDATVQLPPSFPRDAKIWIIEKLVDAVLDQVVGDTEAELLLMNAAEQELELATRRASLEHQMELNKLRYDQEQTNLKAQLDKVEARQQELKRSTRKEWFRWLRRKQKRTK
jgi:hypothetical protein